MKRAIFVLLIGATLGVAPAKSERIELIASVAGNRLTGSEACFFSAQTAKNPFGRYLASNDVRCVSADFVMEIPAGHWNCFVRHSSGYISPNAIIVNISEPYIPELGFRQIRMPMVRSAVLEFSGVRGRLTGDDSFVAYTPPSADGSGGCAYPLREGEVSLQVPADRLLLPLIVRHGRVARILTPVTPAAGSLATVQWRELSSGAFDVVYWIKVDRDGVTDEELRSIEDPVHVVVRGRSTAVTPLYPPAKGSAAHMNLQFVLDVVEQPKEIVLDGKFWEEEHLQVHGVDEGTTLNVTDPVVAIPAGSIRLSVNGDQSIGASASPIAARLHVCGIGEPGVQPPKLDARRCRVFRQVDNVTSDVLFSGLPARTYVVEVYEHGGSRFRSVYAAPGVETHVVVRRGNSAIEFISSAQ